MPSPENDGRLRLILNADDFGYDDDTVEATIECFRASALTSATIMLGMPATPGALEFARENPELDFGVHLVFTGDTGLGAARRRRARSLAGRCRRPLPAGAGGASKGPRRPAGTG